MFENSMRLHFISVRSGRMAYSENIDYSCIKDFTNLSEFTEFHEGGVCAK